jgi:hypothetical protein
MPVWRKKFKTKGGWMNRPTIEERFSYGNPYKEPYELRATRYVNNFPSVGGMVPLSTIAKYGQYSYDNPGDPAMIAWMLELDRREKARKALALQRLQPWIIRNVSNTVNYGSSDWEYK